MDYVRRSYHALRAAPPVADVRRLPPPEAIRQALEFCRAYRCRLGQQALAARPHERDWYEEALCEAARVERVYETMGWVVSSSAWAAQRQGLQEIRALLGAEAYAAGAWPPPAPPHRLRQID